MSYMVHVFCGWREESPDIVTGKHWIVEPASGEPFSASSWVLEGLDVAGQHIWP